MLENILKKEGYINPEDKKKEYKYLKEIVEKYYYPGKTKRRKSLSTVSSFFSDNVMDQLNLQRFIDDENPSNYSIPDNSAEKKEVLEYVINDHLDSLKEKYGSNKTEKILNALAMGFLSFDQQVNYFSKITSDLINKKNIDKVFLVGRDPVFFHPTSNCYKQELPVEIIGISSYTEVGKDLNVEALKRKLMEHIDKGITDVSKIHNSLNELYKKYAIPNSKFDKLLQKISDHSNRKEIAILDSAFVGSQPLIFKVLSKKYNGNPEKIHTGVFVPVNQEHKEKIDTLSKLHSYYKNIYPNKETTVQRNLFEVISKPITSYDKLNKVNFIFGDYYKDIKEYRKKLSKYKIKNLFYKNKDYLLDELNKDFRKFSNYEALDTHCALNIGMESALEAHKKGDLNKGKEKLSKLVKEYLI